MPKIQGSDNWPEGQEQRDSDDSVDGQFAWIGERRERLNAATQETRFDILQNIISHPSQLPTLKELDFFLMGVSQSTIREHLETLIDAGVVARIELPEEEQTRDLPHVFYGLTEAGREDLKEIGFLEAEKTLQEVTMRTELRPDVKRYMTAPRPEWDPAKEFNPEA